MSAVQRIIASPTLKPLDIERALIWTYQDQQAHRRARGREAGTANAGRSGVVCSTFVAMRAVALGARVDCSAAGIRHMADSFTEPHPDAVEIDRSVACLPKDVAGLVIRYAVYGARPDAMVGVAQRFMPVPRDNGRPQMEYWDKERRRPAWCPVHLVPSTAEIEAARAEYRLWWHGLQALTGGQPWDLTRWRVTGPVAPEEPWG